MSVNWEEERVYVRDYREEPASAKYLSSQPQRCEGKWLALDRGGHYMHRCQTTLRRGVTYFFKTGCRCSELDAKYCSPLCCFPYQCSACGRRSCKDCYIANANDRCAYCCYLEDDCWCPAHDTDSNSLSHEEDCIHHNT